MDLGPAVVSFLKWDVVAVDETGHRVALLDPGGDRGAVFSTESGLLQVEPKSKLMNLLTTSGVWTDERLPSTRSLLSLVKMVVDPGTGESMQ